MVFTALLLDQSWSMAGKEGEVVQAANRFMDQLAREAVDQQVALSTFAHTVDRTRPFQGLGAYVPLTARDYQPDGDTALYDALAGTIRSMQPLVGEAHRGVVAVVTDGQDTCSQTDARAVRATMDALRATGRWLFVFLALGSVSPPDQLREELGLSEGDVLSGDKAALPAAMKQLTARVRGYLHA